MTRQAPHGDSGFRAGFPVFVIFPHADVGPDQGQRAKLGDKETIAVAFFDNAVAYAKRGERQLALEFFNRALPIFKEVGDRKNEALTLGDTGLIYYGLGDRQRALECFEEALPIFQDQKVGNRECEAWMLHHIGLIYSERVEQWQQRALEFFSQAALAFHEVGDRKNEAGALSSSGSCYCGLDDMQQAVEAFNKAQEIYKELGDHESVAEMLYNKSYAYDRLGDWQQAMESYWDAKSLDKPRPDALLSPDAQPEQGKDAVPDAEMQVVETFKGLPRAGQRRVFARLKQIYKKVSRAALSRPRPPVPQWVPQWISKIPKWRGVRIDGPATEWLEKHYGQWLKRFGSPEDRIYRDQIKPHDPKLLQGIANQLNEAGEGEKPRDYIPTRSARIDAAFKNDPEVVVHDPRIGAVFATRARRAAKSQASDQPGI